MQQKSDIDVFSTEDLIIMLGAVIERITALTRWMIDNTDKIHSCDVEMIEDLYDLAEKIKRILDRRGISYDFYVKR